LEQRAERGRRLVALPLLAQEEGPAQPLERRDAVLGIAPIAGCGRGRRAPQVAERRQLLRFLGRDRARGLRPGTGGGLVEERLESLPLDRVGRERVRALPGVALAVVQLAPRRADEAEARVA